MKTALVILTFSLMSGCKSAPPPKVTGPTIAKEAPKPPAAPVRPCEGPLEDVTLDKLSPLVGHCWLADSTGEIADCRKEIVKLRKWSSGLADKCYRDEYGKWLDFYTRELNDQEHQVRAANAVSQFERTHKIPAP